MILEGDVDDEVLVLVNRDIHDMMSCAHNLVSIQGHHLLHNKEYGVSTIQRGRCEDRSGVT